MAKKLEAWQIVVIFFIAVSFLVGGFFILRHYGVAPLSLVPFTIDEVQVLDEGTQIRIFGRVGGGEELDIVFGEGNQAFLNKLRAEGYDATDSVRLSAEFTEHSKEFRFATTGTTPIYRVNSAPSGGYRVYFGVFRSAGDDVSDCINHGYTNTIARTVRDVVLTSYYVDCWEDTIYGETSDFTGGETKNFEVLFTLGGVTKKLTQDSRHINFGDGNEISFDGTLGEINDITAPNYDVYHKESLWQLVDDGVADSLGSSLDQFAACAASWYYKDDMLNNCWDVYQERLVSRLASRNNDYLDTESIAGSLSFITGTMEVELTSPSFVPTFTIDLNAESVGIVKLSGKPDIVQCIPNIVFESAGSKQATARVKNVGSQEGSFDFAIDCDNSYMDGQANSMDFSSGQTKTVYVQLSGGNPGEDTNEARCEFIVTDSNNEDNTDSCFFNFDVEYDPATGDCVAGETMCSPDGKTLFTCEDGKFQPHLCPQTPEQQVCAFVGNTHQCVVDPNPPNGDCEWWDLGCWFKKLIDWFKKSFDFLTIIYWAIVIIVPLILIFVVENFLQGIRGLSDKTAVRWIISLAISIAAGIFLGMFVGGTVFWILLILSIAFLFLSGWLRRLLP